MADETRYEIHLLGEFCITDGTSSISERSLRSKRLLLLFAYLVEMHHRRIPSGELIDLIWMEGEVAHPAEALKNLVYRLRTVLSKVWPGVSFIRSEKGYYFLDPELPLWIDTEELEELFEQCQCLDASDPVMRRELFRRLVDLPKGQFLPGSQDIFWVSNYENYLRNRYQKALSGYCGQLFEEGDWDEIKRVCLRALEFDPLLEEFTVFLMKAYASENRADLAKEHYRRTREIYHRLIGEDVTDSIRDVYEELMKRENAEESDLRAIQSRLLEEQQESGAYYCDYGHFVKIYDLEARRFARDHRPITLGLISLSAGRDEHSDEHSVGYSDRNSDGYSDGCSDEVQEEMESLREAIRRTLRGGDVVTRYSGSQYLIMLPGCEVNNGETVIGRIRKSFYQNRKVRQCNLNYKLRDMLVE